MQIPFHYLTFQRSIQLPLPCYFPKKYFFYKYQKKGRINKARNGYCSKIMPKRNQQMAKKIGETEKPPKFDITVNEFGEITQTIKTEEINRFLNENTDDLKLNQAENEIVFVEN
jgi:hypothetical protein